MIYNNIKKAKFIDRPNQFLKDTKYEFYSTVERGREIEFSYNGKNYLK